MVRTFRIGALIAFLACTAPSWGQVLQQERYVMVKEDGKNPVKCKVLKTWKDRDGNTVSQVQPEDGGPVMTITEGDPSRSTPLKERIGFFGKNSSSTVESEPTSAPSRFSRVFGKSTSSTKQTIVHPTIVPASSGGVKPQTAPPPVIKSEVVPAQPADYRQSWGKVEYTPTNSRAALPLAKRENSDPIERPDVYTNAAIPTPSNPASRTVLPVGTITTQPTKSIVPPAAPMTPAPETLLPVSASNSLPPTPVTDVPLKPTPAPANPTVVGTPAGDCNPCPQPTLCPPCPTKVECKPCVTKKNCTPCATKTDCRTCENKTTDCTTCASPSKILEKPRLSKKCDTCGEKPGLLTNLFSSKKETMVVTQTGEVGYERRGLLSHIGSGETVIKEPKPLIVRERPIKARETVVKETVLSEPLPKLVSPLPRNEGRIGIFSGLNVEKPISAAKAERAARQSSTLPRGMASFAAAESSAVHSHTQIGALVRQPDGSTSLVPANQVDPRVASIPVAASNAFTINQSTIPYVAMSPDQAANAWSMATPTRPIPADFGSVPVVPNGFAARGMGGAEARPPMQVAGYYPPQPTGYLPPQVAYGYPVQPMPHPSALLPAGSATVSDQANPLTSQAVATLHGAIMPSERERAAEQLVNANWKADPHVLPALVTAAQTDPAPSVRVTCLRVLGQMKVNTEPVVEAVKTLREDRDARVRQEANNLLPKLLKP